MLNGLGIVKIVVHGWAGCMEDKVAQNRLSKALSRLETVISESGISRLADLTELDRIGIPVWTAIRPLGRSLSSCQGKGMTDKEAQLSCVGESIETWRLETMTSSDYGGDVRAVNLDGNMTELRDCRIIDQISLDLRTFRDQSNSALRNSNGVGSDWNVEYAISHAFNEIVERRSIEVWRQLTYMQCLEKLISISYLEKVSRRVDRLLRSLQDSDILITLWDLTLKNSFPVILCVIGERDPQHIPQLSEGVGCSACPIRAIERAILEAVQSRLTLISGSRDDLTHQFYRQYDVLKVKREPPPIGRWTPCLNKREYNMEDVLTQITSKKLKPRDLTVLRLTKGCHDYTTIKIHHPSLLTPNRSINV